MPKYYIGVDIGVTKTKAALISANYKIKKSIVFLTETNKGINVVKNNVVNAINEVWDKNVVAIGVGFPAPVDPIKGTADVASHISGAKNFNIKLFLQGKFKTKVFVENDANCFALAEAKLGNGKKKKIVVGLTIGASLGCGIIINGEIYRGASGAAGEIGQIPFKGITLEEYAAAPALKRLSTYQGLTMSPIKLAEMAKRNKGFAKGVFKEYGVNVGVALSVLANTFDPEVIVLGGSISKSYPYFKVNMTHTLKKHVYPATFKTLKIFKGKLTDAAVIGAAMVAMQKK